jgi:CDP-diacylglycerol--glycerol-3-phosphate 3-phosphatidyltransferase
LFNKYNELNQREEIDKKDENAAYIYPLCQIFDSNILIDELVTKKFFEYSPDSSKIHLAAGYFNLTQDYEKLITLSSAADYKLLIASPSANGFFAGQGLCLFSIEIGIYKVLIILGFHTNIPKIYSYLEENFYKFIKSKNQEKRIKLYEYERNGWTFHGKGY